MSNFETSTTLSKYFVEVEKVADLLTIEEEHALAIRIQNGDEAAINKLVRSHLKYVVKMANTFIGQGVPIDDLIQEGNLGLYEAAKRYTPDQGKFLTYARFWIQKHLNLALCKQSRTVRLPVNQEYEIYKKKKNGKSVNLTNVHIDQTVSDDNKTNLSDLMFHEDFNDPFKNDEQTRILKILLDTISDTERIVINLFYGLGDHKKMSTKEIANEIGKNSAQVNRILKSARLKMRNQIK
ncbi:MAG: sigma-70 family RNA polymerase sigma factor [Bacilli bacterium]